MAIKQVYELTQEGVDTIKEELNELKHVRRLENLEAIKEARAQGDLSENADYDAARNEQARIESRISEIETILKNVKIIKTSADDVVNIGKQVSLLFLEKNETRIYKLVGTIEANPRDGKISITSPIGRALRGHQKDDVVSVKSETGRLFQIKILDINNGDLQKM